MNAKKIKRCVTRFVNEYWLCIGDTTFEFEEISPEECHINFEKADVGFTVNKDGVTFDFPVGTMHWVWVILLRRLSNAVED